MYPGYDKTPCKYTGFHFVHRNRLLENEPAVIWQTSDGHKHALGPPQVA